MRSLAFLSFALFCVNALAQADLKLSNNQYAYYGAEFYKKKPTKSSLYRILSEYHIISKNAPDEISSVCISNCYKHMSVGYDGARKILFGELFVQKDAQGMFVEDVYCGKKFHFRDVNDVSNMHSEVNIEHTWPQSKFTRSFDKNMQKSDMHHLFPTDSLANNRRANHDFGNVDDSHDELNVQNCSISQLTDISGHFVFEPPQNHKGNVARALFYFATRYNLAIHPSAEMILRQWHKLDPVDTAERKRHEIIVRYQKVRNPFVDYPELVEKVADF
jgi:deoxyribonuclease I